MNSYPYIIIPTGMETNFLGVLERLSDAESRLCSSFSLGSIIVWRWDGVPMKASGGRSRERRFGPLPTGKIATLFPMHTPARDRVLPWVFTIGMVGGAVAFLPFPSFAFLPPKLPFLGMAAVSGLLLCLRGAGNTAVLFRTWAWRFLLLFFAVVFLSPLWSVSLVLSIVGDASRFEGAMAYVLFLALAVTGACLVTLEQGRLLLLRVLTWSAVPVVLYGILQVVGLDPLSSAWQEELFLGRIFSTLGHPNFLGVFLLLTLPFVELRIGERGRGKWFWMGTVVLGAVVLAGTASRAAFLGLAAALLLLAFLLFPSRGSRKSARRTRAMTVLFLCATILVVVTVGGMAIVRRLDVPTQTLGLGARGVIWRAAGAMVAARPWGWGLDTMGSVSPGFMPAELFSYESLTTQIDRAHGKPFDLLLTLGPLGLIAYYGFLVFLFFRLWKKRDDPLAAAAFLSLAGAGVALLFGFDVLPTHAFFWLIAGLGLGMTVGKARPAGKAARLPLHILLAACIAVTFLSFSWLYARGWLERGQKASAAGDVAAAVHATVRAAELFPFDRIALLRAAERSLDAWDRAGDDRSRAALELAATWASGRLALLLPPQDATPSLLMAQLAAVRGDVSEVTRHVDDALRLWPTSVLAHRAAATSLRRVGEGEKADAVTRDLIQLFPPWWRDRESPRGRILWKEHPWLEELLPYAVE